MIPDLLDRVDGLDLVKAGMRVARVLVDKVPLYQVTETPGEDLEVQLEEVRNEIAYNHPLADVQVITFYA